MKLHAIAIVIAASTATIAWGQAPAPLEPIHAVAPSSQACAPPNDHLGHACDAFNRRIRANFSNREIGMLFGAPTAYPEYLTGGFDRVQRRYRIVARQYDLARQQDAIARVGAE